MKQSQQTQPQKNTSTDTFEGAQAWAEQWCERRGIQPIPDRQEQKAEQPNAQPS